ncbi:hypothetical protein BV210_16595 [Halorientalis sp. IM1011]|uniref:hypothetical protein n=1 Tax=Halorientalis sp. IM1011 TaxID=1932360 RepID=UPI00097CD255|nr:hypothetical protein [Halorientalis sp. IM1011]AQL44232.1 hypothetical protein BV210_16595 [Halorientalis sp. IM1011]
MATEPVDDHDSPETGLDACMSELTAEIDRLWEDQHDGADLSAGGNGTGDGNREAGSETPAAVIDAVVDSPS